MPTHPRSLRRTEREAIRRQVYREEKQCWVCGGAVDFTLGSPHPGSPSLDEIVPMSAGGSHVDRSNIRLAHRGCNSRRGNRAVAHVQARQGTMLKTSRKW